MVIDWEEKYGRYAGRKERMTGSSTPFIIDWNEVYKKPTGTNFSVESMAIRKKQEDEKKKLLKSQEPDYYENPVEGVKRLSKELISGTYNAGKGLVKGIISNVTNTAHNISAPIEASIYGKANEDIAKQKEQMNQMLLSKMKAEKDPTKKEKLTQIFKNYNNTSQGINIEEAVPELKKTNLQVVGDFAGLTADILTAGTSSKARALFGVGSAYGFTGALQQGKTDIKDIAKDTILGGIITLGAGKILNAIGKPLQAKLRVATTGADMPLNKMDYERVLKQGMKDGIFTSMEDAPKYNEYIDLYKKSQSGTGKIKLGYQNMNPVDADLQIALSDKALGKGEPRIGANQLGDELLQTIKDQPTGTGMRTLSGKPMDIMKTPKGETSAFATTGVDNITGQPKLSEVVQHQGTKVNVKAEPTYAMDIDAKITPEEKVTQQIDKTYAHNVEDVLNSKTTSDKLILPKEVGIKEKVLRLASSGEATLKKQGKAGEVTAQLILAQRDAQQKMAGNYRATVKKSLEGLSKDQRLVVSGILDGRIPAGGDDRQVISAVQNIRGVLDDIGKQAQSLGFEIRTPDGGKVPFQLRENFFPHVHDLTELSKVKNRTKYLQNIVDSGQANSLQEANEMFEKFVKGKGERTAGSLEHARTLDMPGYELDPEKALDVYINDSTRRITEAQHYGNNDEIANKLIEKIRQEGGDDKFAQQVFDYMVGKTEKPHQLTKAIDTAIKWNYITKLDLAFLTNMTQPINTAAKTGVIRTLDSVMRTYGQGIQSLLTKKMGKLEENALRGGALNEFITKGSAEKLSMGTLMKTVLAPFSWVEKMNRVSAFDAGTSFTKALFDKVNSNPTNKYAIRQLRGLGLDPEKIIAQGGVTPDDILKGAKSIADKTQFQVEAIDIPPAWKSDIGRLVTQMKSFSFKQTKFVKEEVFREARYGNFLPLMRLVAIAVPLSYGAQAVRNKLTGRKETDESGLDIRKWDKYAKAFGTVPTDLAVQGKFIYDTFTNEYATPIQKVGRVASTVLGPTAGEVATIIDALEQIPTKQRENKNLAKGKQAVDPYLGLKRYGASAIPVVGEYLKNTYLAYPKDNKSYFARMLQALETNDKKTLDKYLNEYDKKSQGSIKASLYSTLQEKGNPPTNSLYKSLEPKSKKKGW